MYHNDIESFADEEKKKTAAVVITIIHVIQQFLTKTSVTFTAEANGVPVQKSFCYRSK